MEYVLPKVLLHLLRYPLHASFSPCQRNSLLQCFPTLSFLDLLEDVIPLSVYYYPLNINYTILFHPPMHLPPTFTIWISRISLLNFESKTTLLTIHSHHSNNWDGEGWQLRLHMQCWLLTYMRHIYSNTVLVAAKFSSLQKKPKKTLVPQCALCTTRCV